VPPIYQPEVAARGVVFAADHPQRKQYWVGAGAAYTIFGQKFVPALLDYYLARTGYKSQQTGEKVGPDRPHNLWEPVDGEGGTDHGAHGVFDGKAHEHAPQLFFSHHVREVSAAAEASFHAGEGPWSAMAGARGRITVALGVGIVAVVVVLRRRR